MHKNLCVVFTDYEKAFDRALTMDRVKHEGTMKDLKQLDIDEKDRRLLKTTCIWNRLQPPHRMAS